MYARAVGWLLIDRLAVDADGRYRGGVQRAFREQLPGRLGVHRPRHVIQATELDDAQVVGEGAQDARRDSARPGMGQAVDEPGRCRMAVGADGRVDEDDIDTVERGPAVHANDERHEPPPCIA